MTNESRLAKIEQMVPEMCGRHDEQIKAICACTEEIKDAVKWALRTVVGAVFVALVSTTVTILVTRALAKGP